MQGMIMRRQAVDALPVLRLMPCYLPGPAQVVDLHIMGGKGLKPDLLYRQMHTQIMTATHQQLTIASKMQFHQVGKGSISNWQQSLAVKWTKFIQKMHTIPVQRLTEQASSSSKDTCTQHWYILLFVSRSLSVKLMVFHHLSVYA